MLMPIHARRRQLYVPLDILSATGLDRDGFLAGEDKVRISAAIEAFAGLGLEHLEKARRAGPIPASVFPAFLPVALSKAVLVRARAIGASALDGGLQQAQWRRQITMMKAAFLRRL
jgi:phytoene synthase